MKSLRDRISLVLSALLLACTASAQAQSTITELYIPSNGLPVAQGWLPLILGTAGNETLGSGSFVIDTMADPATQHGYARISPVVLDTSAGFMLTFNVRVDAASSSSVNRGGFSLLLVGNDPGKALELVFGLSEVFVYDYVAGDPDRFVHGPGAAVPAGAPHAYVLRVANDAYTLNIDGQDLISGSFVDYTAQGLPYTTPNFVFFGDDTTRAAASVSLGPLVLLTEVPEPASAWLWLAGLVAMAGWLRARRR